MSSLVRFGYPFRTSNVVKTSISPLSSLGRIRRYHRHAALVDPLVPFRGNSPRRHSIFPADPFAMLDEMQNVMKSLDRDFFKDVSKFTTPSRGFRHLQEGGGDTPLRALSSTLGSVDVHETDHHYIISVDCPGVTQDDVKLSIKEQDGGHVLTISGERNVVKTSSSSDEHHTTDGKKKIAESTTPTTDDTPTDTSLSTHPSSSSVATTTSSSSPSTEVTWHLQERSIGAFERHFWLPQNLNVDSSSADFTNGVLTVIFEKQSAEKAPKEKIIKIAKKE